MTKKKITPVKNHNDVTDVYRWFSTQYPDWRPESGEDQFKVVFRWPFPVTRDTDTQPVEIISSIDEWCAQLWKDFNLDQDEFGEEGSFFHIWGYSTGSGGQLTLTLCSPMTEAISDAMGQALYYILTCKGFSITFTADH